MPTNTPPIAERTGETGDAGSFIPVNNRIESDHGQLKRRLRPAWPNDQRQRQNGHRRHAFIHSIRHGHYELAADSAPKLRIAAAFDELAQPV